MESRFYSLLVPLYTNTLITYIKWRKIYKLNTVKNKKNQNKVVLENYMYIKIILIELMYIIFVPEYFYFSGP